MKICDSIGPSPNEWNANDSGADFVPLIFIKGKQAKLAPGTVFDAMVAQPTDIDGETDEVMLDLEL